MKMPCEPAVSALSMGDTTESGDPVKAAESAAPPAKTSSRMKAEAWNWRQTRAQEEGRVRGGGVGAAAAAALERGPGVTRARPEDV